MGAGAWPRDAPTIILRYDRGKAIPLVEGLRGDLLRSPRLTFERGNPFGDAFVVDRSDRNSVSGRRQSD
jgi:hypothetical protein